MAASLVGRGEAVGLQVAVRQRGKVLADVAAGTLGTADPRPVRRSSLFNVFRLGLVLWCRKGTLKGRALRLPSASSAMCLGRYTIPRRV